jgi:hypothetical protein
MKAKATPLENLFWIMKQRVEALFAERGGLPAMVFITENGAEGTRNKFETPCTVGRDVASDSEFLSQLSYELRLDFGDEGVSCFACAYPARVTHLRTPAHQPKNIEAVVIEAHCREGGHMCAHREVIADPLRLGALSPIENVIGAFGSLLNTGAIR